MKVVVAIDSFKGSLSSMQAGQAAADGILRVYPDADINILPVADGGEGTVEALVAGMGGELHRIEVTGPLGTPIVADYGMLPQSNTAIIEMAAAAGITLIPAKERNPLLTTTYGVGEMIQDALLNGAKNIIVGIGGSATNDGGVGMLQALGYRFSDAEGNSVPFGARGLPLIESISDEAVLPQLKQCKFKVACDVTNVLCGETGCSHIYGPQKGATMDMILDMDRWMGHFAERTQIFNSAADPLYPGTGAAGGLGFAFLAYTNAVLESGISIVLNEIKLEQYVKDADLVLTGEGRLDGQTVMGKAPVGIAHIAKKYGKPVFAFSGMVTEDAALCNESGIDAFFPILRKVVSLEDAMRTENAAKNMTDTVEQVFRLWSVGR